jgi:Na+-translocating ferredoxin:NAD+ oxidoreductase subunit B
MSEKLYRELQERLDTYSLGFPATASGIEISILKRLFSIQNAEMFLALTPMVEPPEAVAKKMGIPVEQAASRLEEMAKKGLVFRLGKADGPYYGAIPFIHGLWEFQVNRIDPEFAAMTERYMAEGLDKAMVKSAAYFLRTIPVGESVDAGYRVASYDDAWEILRSKKLIVITDCICRKQKSLVAENCGKPLEACFMFGSMGQYYLDHGMGRQVDIEEAQKILSDARDAGLVTQPATAQNPAGMCNCCGDCCGVLRVLNMQPKPAEIVFSNHYAVVVEEECTACGACEARCQMAAINVVESGVAVVNRDRCIGCGLCVTDCPTGAVKLVPKPNDEQRIPPRGSMDQMIAMAQKRGIM